MKNNLIIGFLFGIMMTIISSFTTTNNLPSHTYTQRVVIPLKQKRIIVTESYKKVKLMLKGGYVLQDVDWVVFNMKNSGLDVKKYYTLIKY